MLKQHTQTTINHKIMKNLIKKIPVLGPLSIFLKNKIFLKKEFTNSKDYWMNRYEQGGNSGAGSYNNLAEFKCEIINEFVSSTNLETVIELGFGDGNQLEYFQFKSYTGFDISNAVIEKCREKFKNDTSKHFMHMDSITNQKAEMVMSLDVIYHLIEDEVYNSYMNNLFDLSNRYVIIYALDSDDSDNYQAHVKPRKFTSWIDANRLEFKLIKHIPNRYPFDKKKPKSTSFADFYIFEKVN